MSKHHSVIASDSEAIQRRPVWGCPAAELEGYLAARGYWLEAVADRDRATAAGVGYAGKKGDDTSDAVRLVRLSEELERVRRENTDLKKKNAKLQADCQPREHGS